jgi:septum formation protein
MPDSIILASQSPRRRQLLEWAEVPFDVIVPLTDESYPPGLPAVEVPVHIARAKALAVHASLHNSEKLPTFDWPGLELATSEFSSFLAGVRRRTILAADTVVVLGEEIIGKPRDREDAIAILGRLAGQEHRVITGVCCKKGDREVLFSDTTRVFFHPLTEGQIAFYVDKYRPYDKAGAYAIQEWIGVVGIKSVEGDFYNVMGLPVSRVVRVLGEMG